MAEPLSLGQLGRVLLRYWVLIVVGTLVGAALAFGVTRLMTPVYRATATQLVKGLPGTGSAATYEAAQYAVSRAKTYPSFVYNSGVLENVRNDLGGTRTVVDLRKDLSVTNPQNTPLLEIAALAPTPEEAQDKANSAARHLARFITEIETVGNRSPISVETAVQAALPTEAAAPKTLVITALGAVLGFVLATLAALLNSYVRYQRRSAFRRQRAMSWVKGEPGGGPAAAPDGLVPEAAASDPRPDAVPSGGPTSGAEPVVASPVAVPPAPRPDAEPAPAESVSVEPASPAEPAPPRSVDPPAPAPTEVTPRTGGTADVAPVPVVHPEPEMDGDATVLISPADLRAAAEPPAEQLALVEPHDTEPVTTSVQTKPDPTVGRPVPAPPPRPHGTDDLDDTVAIAVFDRAAEPPVTQDRPGTIESAADPSPEPEVAGSDPGTRPEFGPEADGDDSPAESESNGDGGRAHPVVITQPAGR